MQNWCQVLFLTEYFESDASATFSAKQAINKAFLEVRWHPVDGNSDVDFSETL